MECYRVAEKHGKEIIASEPFKSGKLKNLPAEAKNLLSYFLFRYIANEEYDEKITTVVAFCVLSVRLIATLWRNFAKTEEDMIEICRLYSQEIEYSTENVYDLFDIIEGYDEI